MLLSFRKLGFKMLILMVLA